MTSLWSRSLTLNYAFTLCSNVKCSEHFSAFQATAHDISIDTDVLIQLIPARHFNPLCLDWKKNIWEKVFIFMLACTTIITRVRTCNNVLQPEHYVLVISLDQCFVASLLMEGIESNYIAPLRCYSNSIMVLILFLLLP